MQGVETFLNNLFYESAKRRESEMRNKEYSYILYGADFSFVVRKGVCVVETIRYDRSLDCDVISCVDIKTGETFSCNQFRICLEKITD